MIHIPLGQWRVCPSDSPVPARYPGWHTVVGELQFRLGRHSAAEIAWREALSFTTARADREFLHRRLAACQPDGNEPAAG